MGKQLLCGDVVPGCQFKANAENEEGIMQQVAAHVAEVHAGLDVTPAVIEKVRGAIREQ
jgi:predicted small metal-binding protein